MYYEASHQENITWALPRICLGDLENTIEVRAARPVHEARGFCFTPKPVKIILPPENVSVSSSQDPDTRFSKKRA
jgi:hypothetical protein